MPRWSLSTRELCCVPPALLCAIELRGPDGVRDSSLEAPLVVFMSMEAFVSNSLASLVVKLLFSNLRKI